MIFINKNTDKNSKKIMIFLMKSTDFVFSIFDRDIEIKVNCHDCAKCLIGVVNGSSLINS